MENRYFLEKAEQLRPDLFEEYKSVEGSEQPMKNGDEMIFDFGNHYVGYVSIDFDSVGHHPDAPLYFQIQFAEIKDELNQNVEEYHGWISKSWVQEEKIHIDVLPSLCSLPRRYAFRYIRIRIISVSDNYSVIIRRVTVKAVSSADDGKLKHVSLNEKDRKLDEISVRTLHSCMQEVFEDGPKRDRRLWLGDLRLEALANYETFQNNNLVKRCLYLFAGTTLEEGRLANNLFIQPKVECDYQTMFDYTLFFINTLWDYYCATGDRETLQELEPVCMTQYELLKKCFDEKHVLELSKAGNIFIDWNLELDRQACGQAVYIYSLKDLVRIEKELGKDCNALEEEIADKQKAALSMYDKNAGVFVSGEKKQISYMTQIWMILAEVADRELGEEILENVEKYDALQMNSPYAYHHYIQALINIGQEEKAYQKMHAYWDGMIEKGTDTFWELYNPEDPDVSPYGGIIVHSFCHAWSCTPTYFLRKYYTETA